MKPGEIITKKNSEIILNKDRTAITIKVSNKGDRPIQVGSHYHFAETNDFLDFDRDVSKGMRLNIPDTRLVQQLMHPGRVHQLEQVQPERLRLPPVQWGGQLPAFQIF